MTKTWHIFKSGLDIQDQKQVFRKEYGIISTAWCHYRSESYLLQGEIILEKIHQKNLLNPAFAVHC